MADILGGLDVESYDRQYPDRELVRRTVSYFRTKTRLVYLIAGAVVLGSLVGAAMPVLLARGVNAVAGNADMSSAAALVVAILLAGIVTWVLGLLRERYSAVVTGDLIRKLRENAFDATMAQDMAFFDEHPTGGIASRIASDTQAFAEMVRIILRVVGELLLVVFLMLVLFYINPRLAIVTLLLALVVIALTHGFRRIARRFAQSQQRALARLNAHLQESLSGIFVARNFGRERALYEDLVQVNDRWYRTARRVNMLFTGIFSLMQTVAGLGMVAVVYVGGRAVASANLTPGDWYLFLQTVSLFWMPLTSITSFWSQFQQGLAAGERVFALMDADRHVTQTEQRPVSGLYGKIEFQGVTFGYTERETVLANFDLCIGAGETVALVGHTGAGKSSIARLIARSYEFQAGRIMVDGQDIRTLDLDEYRRHLGIVPQLPFLFSGTVADNIQYARPDASNEEVVAAANCVADGGWLAQLSQGLRTPVGEMGKNLATGQRQLVALARVLLQNPSILILDEATASVDPLTEAHIQEGLRTVLRDRTAVVIAHRLPTVRKADRIITLSNGEIVEQGSHRELMRAGGHYSEFYNHYFRHQTPHWDAADGAAPG